MTKRTAWGVFNIPRLLFFIGLAQSARESAQLASFKASGRACPADRLAEPLRGKNF